jgi:hypothetical protein
VALTQRPNVHFGCSTSKLRMPASQFNQLARQTHNKNQNASQQQQPAGWPVSHKSANMTGWLPFKFENVSIGGIIGQRPIKNLKRPVGANIHSIHRIIQGSQQIHSFHYPFQFSNYSYSVLESDVGLLGSIKFPCTNFEASFFFFI